MEGDMSEKLNFYTPKKIIQNLLTPANGCGNK
jgi:hypothetical protein